MIIVPNPEFEESDALIHNLLDLSLCYGFRQKDLLHDGFLVQANR